MFFHGMQSGFDGAIAHADPAQANWPRDHIRVATASRNSADQVMHAA
jgi:hypothetical protein